MVVVVADVVVSGSYARTTACCLKVISFRLESSVSFVNISRGSVCSMVTRRQSH